MWWEPGAIYQDDCILQIPQDAQGFSAVQLHIGWYNEDIGERLPVPYPSNMLELPRIAFGSQEV